ncbi:MAG: transposase [Muribaculum sp.]|nr:transposase [Muribaculum sp.]
MSIHKITPFLSDIKTFFKKSDMTAAMQNIANILGSVKMTERDTIGVVSKRNHVYRLLSVFQCLLMLPLFGIQKISGVENGNAIASIMSAHKDTFYRFLDNPDVNWRKALWRISIQLWDKIRIRTDHKTTDVCLIIDDTDQEKTGRMIEKIGRVHSHLRHKAVLGFKCLAMAVTDGVSQLLLELELLGEKGKSGNYGMSAKELKKRKVSKQTSDLLDERKTAYDTSKIELAKEMIRRAIRHKLKFKYVLADSWFTNKEIVKFIHSLHVGCHWLGMIKVGEKSRTKYKVGGEELTAPQLVRKGKKEKLKKYSRRLRCHYIQYDAVFGGVKVRIFLTRRTDHGSWNGMLTTDTTLDFAKAWEIYSRRWALEVVFKDCKTHLGFGKCQSHTFAAQIAASTICAIQYNLLSTARRFSDYETIGNLFREACADTVQLSVAQQIWGVLQELVNAIADAFGLMDEDIYEVIINESQKMAHICKFYNLSTAS